MSESNALNWKEKYLSALEEFETSQNQDQQRLDLLRRGLVRVSLAADGLDESLDQQLDEMRTALRSGRDIKTLEPMVSQLESTIIALDDRRKDEHGEVQALIEGQLDKYLNLSLPRAEKSSIKKLRKTVSSLLSGNGMNPDIWKGLNQVHDQVTSHLMQRIDELSENKPGFLSRLLSSGKASDASIAEHNLDSESEQGDEIGISLEQMPPSKPENNVEVPVSSPSPEALDTESEHTDMLNRLSQILCNLLDHLDVPVDFNIRKEKLVDRIKSPFELDHLPSLLDETTHLVASTRLMAQKEFEGFLVALHQRLNDIQEFLVTAREGEELSLQNQEKLDLDVRQELQEMRANVETSTDLGKLKFDIEDMVNRIVSAVDTFHTVEKQRRDEVYERIESLGQRMESMEAEATELKSSLEAQRLEALRDALTELPNRAAYDEQVNAEFTRWRRHNRPLSLAIIDIDYFKKINDTLGHLRGDKVLRLVAREIARRVRNEDFVARYGVRCRDARNRSSISLCCDGKSTHSH
jgi:diguanylate cyclase